MPELKHKYHKETLRILGIDFKKVIECKGYQHLEADTLIVTSPVRHKGLIPTWLCKSHYKNFVKDAVSKQNKYPPLVYIRRGDSKIRQIINEPELMNLLEKNGFKSYLLSELSFKEQVKLFSSAKVIVSAHGAGLANLAFCQRGTRLIELFAAEYIKPTYQMISKRVGIDYSYIICGSILSKQRMAIKKARNQNIFVDLNEISFIFQK
jgi:capsular polysaccharide biosynthesis protein